MIRLLLRCLIIQFCCSLSLFAQEKPIVVQRFQLVDDVIGEYSKYLFPDFTEGTAFLKNGTSAATVFNYDFLTQEMLFKDGEGQILALNNKDINFVQIQGRRFIPLKKGFAEVIVQGQTSLLLLQKLQLETYKGGAYGAGTSTSAITNITQHQYARGSVTDLAARYKSRYVSTFHLMKSGKIYNADKKGFLKCFPEDKAKINDFLLENKINFEKGEDLVLLLSTLQN